MKEKLEGKIKKGIKNPPKAAKFIYFWTKGYVQCQLIRNKVLQKKKIDSLLSQDRFCLIILDACRYDYFETEYKDYLKGDLEKVWGLARDTFEFVKKMFPQSYTLTYISGAVPINSVLDKLEVSWGQPQKLYQGYVPSKHFKEIIDVWKFGWDFSLGTVPPQAVTETALKYKDRKKLIVHYFQPHAPYIGKPQLLGYTGSKYGAYTGNPPDAKIAKEVKKGLISKEKAQEAYCGNLRLVLKEAAKLIHSFKGIPIVITADHGELLGENNLWFHPRIPHPKLYEVPWFIVRGA